MRPFVSGRRVTDVDMRGLCQRTAGNASGKQTISHLRWTSGYLLGGALGALSGFIVANGTVALAAGTEAAGKRVREFCFLNHPYPAASLRR